MSIRLLVGSALLGWAVALAACGGGGGGAPAEGVTAASPSSIFSKKATSFHVLGEGFTSTGAAVDVTLRAAAGTPFLGGTSASLTVPGVAQSDSLVDTGLPATEVATSFTAFVSVRRGDGVVLESSTPILNVVAQRVTGITPATIDSSATTSVTVTGAGFQTTSSTSATVVFTAAGGGLFHVGTGASNILSVPGTITSGSEVTAAITYAGVLGPTPASIHVVLSDGTTLPGTGTPVTFMPGANGVQGTWTYESVPSTTAGLDYGSTMERPIRGARVQLVKASGGAVVTTRELDANGAYKIAYGGSGSVIVRVLSETGPSHPPIRVEDNTDSDALYSSEGPPLAIGSGFQTADYVATSGWGGASYTGPRAAAPFAIMDVIYEAMSDFLAVRTISFPLCTVNWSIDNRPSAAFDVTTGEIGISHYSGELYILGKEDVDTDEYDQYVVAHEWGHWLEDQLSRSDSIAGPHSIGDYLDPTVAWGEGFGYAVAALVLAPNTINSNAVGIAQATGFGEDIEDNSLDATLPNTGWFSETSIEWLVYDLFDTANEAPHDNVTLGLGELYDVLVGAQKNTPYSTTIFSLISALKTAHPSAAGDIDTLCVLHGITPVADALGTGETNDGGWAPILPVYSPVMVNGPSVARTMFNGSSYNAVDATRRFYFTGTGSAVTIDALTPPPITFLDDFDILVRVYRKGARVADVDDFVTLGELFTLPSTIAGETYVVLIIDISPGSPDYTYPVDLLITSP